MCLYISIYIIFVYIFNSNKKQSLIFQIMYIFQESCTKNAVVTLFDVAWLIAV